MGKASKRKTLRKQGVGPSRAELERRRQETLPRSAGLAEDPALSELIDRTGDLKRELCLYVERPPFRDALKQTHRDRLSGAAAGDRAETARVIDDFIFGYRLPDGSTVVDSFLRQRSWLPTADREMLLAWKHPVEGIFELHRKERDSVVLLNLLDDLEYHTYCNLGPAIFQPLDIGWFLECRLVPVGDVWVISGATVVQHSDRSQDMARQALSVIEINPAVVLRNPVLAQRGWDRQQELRARFIEFFGGDEVILSPGEAAERIDECFRGNTDAGFQLPDAAAQSSTIGFIFDERDGLLACADLGMLRDLFAHPALAKDAEHAATLLGCLGSDSITPAPLERLAEEYPDHADEVFRTVLKRPDFRWEVHGEGLLRERKPWYYGTEPRPSGIVLGDRLMELLRT